MTQDIKWNGDDIERAADGDVAVVTDEDAAIQALAILVRDEVRDLTGSTITPRTLAQATTAVNDAVRSSDDFTNIRSLSITEINKQTNTVSVQASTYSTDDDIDFGVKL
jgi:hypothetical protein